MRASLYACAAGVETNTLLNTIEKENLLRLEAQAQSVHEQLLPWLLPLLEDVPLSEKLNRCYELLRQLHA